jgi:hypothetical protein
METGRTTLAQVRRVDCGYRLTAIIAPLATYANVGVLWKFNGSFRAQIKDDRTRNGRQLKEIRSKTTFFYRSIDCEN